MINLSSPYPVGGGGGDRDGLPQDAPNALRRELRRHRSDVANIFLEQVGELKGIWEE